MPRTPTAGAPARTGTAEGRPSFGSPRSGRVAGGPPSPATRVLPGSVRPTSPPRCVQEHREPPRGRGARLESARTAVPRTREDRGVLDSMGEGGAPQPPSRRPAMGVNPHMYDNALSRRDLMKY